MMDRTHMSGYLAGADNTVQYTLLPGASEYSVHAAPAHWNGNGTPTIYASVANGPYDATNLGTTHYSSDRLSADVCGTASKSTVPVIANGHVYVVGTGALSVYGMTP
jgi:hypothetical protein